MLRHAGYCCNCIDVLGITWFILYTHAFDIAVLFLYKNRRKKRRKGERNHAYLTLGVFLSRVCLFVVSKLNLGLTGYNL